MEILAVSANTQHNTCSFLLKSYHNVEFLSKTYLNEKDTEERPNPQFNLEEIELLLY
jgi:hypothetical protein